MSSGTSGIRLGLAVRLSEAGNKVIVAGRRKNLLDEISAKHPGIDNLLLLDVADPDSIARAANTRAASHPEQDILVNNAGIKLTENVLDPVGLAHDVRKLFHVRLSTSTTRERPARLAWRVRAPTRPRSKRSSVTRHPPTR